MNTEELKRLISNGEGETLELKTTIPPPEIIAHHLAAFANTNGGILVFGVKESAQFVGVNVHRAKVMLLSAQNYLSPSVPVEVSNIIADGHPVIVATVKKNSDLVASSGGYYRRSGAQIRPMNANEIRTHAAAENNDDKALSELSRAVATQTQTIDQLRTDFNNANSLPKKIGIALLGAAGGALLKYAADTFF